MQSTYATDLEKTVSERKGDLGREERGSGASWQQRAMEGYVPLVIFKGKERGRGSFMVPSVEETRRSRAELQNMRTLLQVLAEESQVEQVM